jgi:hypothetical protein
VCDRVFQVIENTDVVYKIGLKPFHVGRLGLKVIHEYARVTSIDSTPDYCLDDILHARINRTHFPGKVPKPYRMYAFEAADLEHAFVGKIKIVMHQPDSPIWQDFRYRSFSRPSRLADSPPMIVRGKTVPWKDVIQIYQLRIGDEVHETGLTSAGNVPV